MDTLLHLDQLHRARMVEASDLFARAIRYERLGVSANLTPRHLVWRDPHLPKNWVKNANSQVSIHNALRIKLGAERMERADSLRITNREPCPMCGVRGDIGCKHKRAA